jgi:hypothetical protein
MKPAIKNHPFMTQKVFGYVQKRSASDYEN